MHVCNNKPFGRRFSSQIHTNLGKCQEHGDDMSWKSQKLIIDLPVLGQGLCGLYSVRAGTPVLYRL